MINSINTFKNQPNFNNGSSFTYLSLLRPTSDSKQYRTMSGYKPTRGDFETEFKDKFEYKYLADLDYELIFQNEIQEIDVENDSENDDFIETIQIENTLKLTILKSYNDLIRERFRRKELIRKFGLLSDIILGDFVNLVKNRFPKQYYQKSHRNVTDNFYHLKTTDKINNFPNNLIHLFKNFDDFLGLQELLSYQLFLSQKLCDLAEYRSNGIKKLRNISIYKNLKLKRLKKVNSIHMASLMASVNRYEESSCTKIYKNMCLDWFKKFVISEKNILEKISSNLLANGRQFSNSPSAYPASHLKYKNNPLKIENYPDSDQLNEEEKEFCRIARIQPTKYLRVKAILIMENTKTGVCTYSRARKIAGIDVNKTRLIHNLLIKLDLIKINRIDDDKINIT